MLIINPRKKKRTKRAKSKAQTKKTTRRGNPLFSEPGFPPPGWALRGGILVPTGKVYRTKRLRKRKGGTMARKKARKTTRARARRKTRLYAIALTRRKTKGKGRKTSLRLVPLRKNPAGFTFNEVIWGLVGFLGAKIVGRWLANVIGKEKASDYELPVMAGLTALLYFSKIRQIPGATTYGALLATIAQALGKYASNVTALKNALTFTPETTGGTKGYINYYPAIEGYVPTSLYEDRPTPTPYTNEYGY
jgi:hypothetical protein